jgi:hypothetical protein
MAYVNEASPKALLIVCDTYGICSRNVSNLGVAAASRIQGNHTFVHDQPILRDHAVVILYVKLKERWRPLSLMKSLKIHGWNSAVILITDDRRFNWQKAYGRIVGGNLRVRYSRAVDSYHAKSHKYEILKWFPEFDSFTYLDSDVLVNVDWEKAFRVFANHSATAPDKMLLSKEIIDPKRPELFHTGWFQVKRNPIMKKCFEDMSHKVKTNKKRDQRMLTILFKEQTCRVHPTIQLRMCFPVAENVSKVDVTNCDFVHFTSARRRLVEDQKYKNYWEKLGLVGLYRNNSVDKLYEKKNRIIV